MTRPAPWRLDDVVPAPRSTEKPTKYGARTRAIRRALVGHVRVTSVTSTFTPSTGGVVTTATPVDRSPGALHGAADRALAQVPWLTSAVTDEQERVVRLLSTGATP